MPSPGEQVESAMAWITDTLTRVRPILFVRRFQVVLVVITLLMVTWMLAIPFFGQDKMDLSPDGLYSEGKTAPEKIVSVKEIIYEDEDKTKAKKLTAYQSAPFVFDRDYATLQDQINNAIQEDMENFRSFKPTTEEKVYSELLNAVPRWKNRSKEEIELLYKTPGKGKLKDLVQQYSNLVFSSFCILRDLPPDYAALKTSGGRVRNQGIKEQISNLEGAYIIPRSFLYRDPNTVNILNRMAEEKLSRMDLAVLPIIQKISLSYIYSNPSCSYNAEETLSVKQFAADRAEPVNSRILAGEVIVKSGEIITPEIFKKLQIVNTYATRANIASIVSILLIQTVFVVIIYIFLKKYNPKRLNDVSSNVIVFSLIWFLVLSCTIASKIYFNFETKYDSIFYFALFVPVGMVCLIISFIYDEQLSIAIGFYLSFFVFMASHYNPTSFMLGFVSCIVSASYGRNLKKRIDFIKAGLYIAGVQIVIASSGYLFDSRNYWVAIPSGSWIKDLVESNIFKLYVLCLINGFACSTAAQFLLPIYEYLFNVPTRFKLMELADTGHPLLQDLLTKAPSTYTHTFLVAALSERACQNLGLDWLLTRVGVYFHDIGKIPNAGFFVENQHLIPKKENIDKNNPALAAKIVIDHVLDGIEMAKKARLPREVIDFIPEHHGTSTMAFFYHKALSELSPTQKKKLKKQDFQYPGPKPQRKETAIVMIADSLEAASRSLEEITPESLDNLITKIIGIKLAENQLDECGLTLGDLEVIKASFKEVLLSSLHSRPKYPSMEATKALEKKNALDSMNGHKQTKAVSGKTN
ncbi:MULTISPECIES: HD family phosphohydrolase [Leptospira]|uniref:HD family phosphohydrolase n=1 Tax=Leptospira TaxID=171 RepID=UPI000292A12C|nr:MULTISPECIES: HDIG domain-containing metalloprotein [Leptospira]EKO79447.1 HDIG domain protein [Leptospira sp. Fiocruz LV3954]EMI63604.1 HDIG domain protein [Leptospira sp. Fiocruz LV4135]EMO84893.1 HDIG domain protein [Leptospira santarosai str. AIM]KXZ31711.1 HD family phosphohydrolase [Leptospira santarosai]MDI7165789.1 HDIG domain-containing protein [Leptospira santarosai]